ncbi:TIGR00725 family protein [candidate division KSB1 bacterium]
MSEKDREFSFSDYVLRIAGRKPLIAVIGAGSCGEDISTLAEQVGKEIAVREGIVVCGGLYGVMEAACRGAKKAGGVTIGVLPGRSIDEANDYIDIPIATGLGIARNALIAHTGRVAVAVDGKYGTLSEIGYFLQLEKPVIGLKTWDIPDIHICSTAVEAAEKAFSFLV